MNFMSKFQLILNPIRDWNNQATNSTNYAQTVPINLKPY